MNERVQMRGMKVWGGLSWCRFKDAVRSTAGMKLLLFVAEASTVCVCVTVQGLKPTYSI